MSVESFHPTLVDQGYVCDGHRAYADWARRTYRRVSDVPAMQAELQQAETKAGDEVRFYTASPNSALPDARREGVVVRRHPFANGDREHMRIWSQVIADMTGMRVISFPNNIGEDTYERFSTSTQAHYRQLGFRAIAMVHAEVVEAHLLSDDEPVYPFGWSEGGAMAAATFAVSNDFFRVPGAGIGDPPNGLIRSSFPPLAYVRLLQDFTGDDGESFDSVVKRAGLPALSAALHRDEPEEVRRKNYHKWLKSIVAHPPIARIRMMNSDGVFKDIQDGLVSHPASKALLFTGELSRIAPKNAIIEGVHEIETQIGCRALSLLVLGKSGHFAADQVFDQGVIATHVTSA